MYDIVRIAIGALILIGCFSEAVSQERSGYRYENCADQQSGVPLAQCATLTIDSTLRRVTLHDSSDQADRVERNNSYFILPSPMVSLAVPRKDSDKQDEWEVAGIIYKKTQKAFSVSILGTQLTVDVISASTSGKVVLVFWYSVPHGVEAIGFPSRGRQSGEVYFCAKRPCLFESGD